MTSSGPQQLATTSSTAARQSAPSATASITTQISTPVLRLRAPPRSRRRIQWAEDVVDNENMGRKRSKICCIYHAPHPVGESSSSSSESDSSDSSSSDNDDGSARMRNRPAVKGGRRRSLHDCDHDHNHSAEHPHGDRDEGEDSSADEGDGDAPRDGVAGKGKGKRKGKEITKMKGHEGKKRSGNAYETLPKARKGRASEG